MLLFVVFEVRVEGLSYVGELLGFLVVSCITLNVVVVSPLVDDFLVRIVVVMLPRKILSHISTLTMQEFILYLFIFLLQSQKK